MALYLIQNAVMQTTAAPAAVTTGTAIKTMLQVAVLVPARIVEYGYSLDAFTAAAPGTIELIETDVAATVTPLAAGDVTRTNAPADAVAAGTVLSFGTAATGFTATAEGTITAVRNLDPVQFIAPSTQPYIKQIPLGRESLIQVGKFARIRVTFPAAVNMRCYLLLEI